MTRSGNRQSRELVIKRMSSIHPNKTRIEILIQELVAAMGYRFMKNVASLPGRPDLVFPTQKKAIFIHGCFWHRHQGCRKSSMPCVNVDYWSKKFATTVERDLQNQANLTNLGWSWLIIWECQLKNLKLVQDSIRKFLEDINGW